MRGTRYRNWTGWDWGALARRRDLAVAPQEVPHGDTFGLPAPDAPRTLGAFARNRTGYVFDAGPAAAGVFARGDVRARLAALARPTPRVDALLGGARSRSRAARSTTVAGT